MHPTITIHEISNKGKLHSQATDQTNIEKTNCSVLKALLHLFHLIPLDLLLH